MIVVSDAGPINYLIQIEQIQLLNLLFSQMVVPAAVVEELSSPSTHPVVRMWMANPPEWMLIQDPQQILNLDKRGKGERAAIALALELHASLLCDDGTARQMARQAGLLVSGTLGVLQQAHKRGLIEIDLTLDRLVNTTNFYITPKLREQVIREAHELRSI